LRFPRTRFRRLSVSSVIIVALLALPAVFTSHTPLPAHAAGNCSVSRSGGSDSEEQSMLTLINNYRQQNGVGPLTPSPTLDRAALWKSSDMAQNDYFSHDDPGRGWLQRLLDCGYPSTNDGEDLAAGNSDAQHTFEQWRTSPPHNANLLSSTFHAIGVGRAEISGSMWYWTADFGPSVDSDASNAPSLVSGPPPPPSSPGHASIGAGSSVSVNTPGDCLRVHASPSLSSSVTACLPDTTPLNITGGSQQSDGYTWWPIATGGWVAGQYLKPSS
jgi:uncharacterized protein YkwD